MMARRYKVHHIPGASDREDEAWFAVRGPRVNEFAVAGQLARVMQTSLNRPALTPREWKLLRQALQSGLAGEWSAGDLQWTDADAAIAHKLLDQL